MHSRGHNRPRKSELKEGALQYIFSHWTSQSLGLTLPCTISLPTPLPLYLFFWLSRMQMEGLSCFFAQ